MSVPHESFVVTSIPVPDRTATAVYVIHGAGLFKIGWTRNVAARMVELQPYSPVPLSLVAYAVVDNARDLEKALHDKFAPQRKHYEWFALEAEHVAYLQTLCTAINTLFTPAHPVIARVCFDSGELLRSEDIVSACNHLVASYRAAQQ